MYCEAPASPERRSAQTAMYEVLRGIVTVIAPILSFTADEIYEAMPGEKEASVHLDRDPEARSRRSPRTTRTTGSACCSCATRCSRCSSARARRSRSASRSKPTSRCTATSTGTSIDLAKLFIVSHVDVAPANATSRLRSTVEGFGRVGIP